MEKQYSKEFAEIIEGKIEGLDYITIGPREPSVWHDGTPAEPDEKDFAQLERDALRERVGVIVGQNGGRYVAFDPTSHQMILTARSDMIDPTKYKLNALGVPFSNQLHEPADPMKAAALIYQSEQRRMHNDADYEQRWKRLDHSDEVAFLKALLPTLKTEEEKEKVTHLIEQYALYTVRSQGYEEGRNDGSNLWGQRVIVSLRERLDKKELQILALKRIKWEQDIVARWAKKDAEKKAAKEAKKNAEIAAKEQAEKERAQKAKFAATVAAKRRNKTLRDEVAGRAWGARKKPTLLDRIKGLTGREKARRIVKDFHERNPKQKTALKD